MNEGVEYFVELEQLGEIDLSETSMVEGESAIAIWYDRTHVCNCPYDWSIAIDEYNYIRKRGPYAQN